MGRVYNIYTTPWIATRDVNPRGGVHFFFFFVYLKATYIIRNNTIKMFYPVLNDKLDVK